ncbi:hypothetical protein JX265_001932 [Neoarthrinium moseri]|uniref:Uncharacterized protein n=1 Tax=Neoarthrinium moseri TaxID=1658444 RepID=A0A9P9WW48_9PEZI|nr:uncharacterized protein JN550_005680 [Neoarthrinium moseri]KAI1847923.1 hypothetical protein JX266_006036 [Neoarthrinium moseri]KAI1869699.1 hypothetical protein JN550_005680 [Neoarthrinium moseri]KAI1880311.1 hypothetical protein JX265_001932 [Neoarthrinium moseri]
MSENYTYSYSRRSGKHEKEYDERRPRSSHVYNGHLPPSPPSSDASFAPSGSDGERAHKRRSGVYINGEKVPDVTRKPSRRERRNSNHVVIVEPPASPRSPRTPPRFDTPVGSPSRSPAYIHQSRMPQYAPPVRPEVRVEVTDHRTGRDNHYYRHVPTPARSRRDSYSYGSSGGSSASDEAIRVQKLERELRKAQEKKKAKEAAEAAEAAARRQRIQSEIEKQNAHIANRSPPSTKPQKYRRGSVAIRPEENLAKAFQKVHIRESEVHETEEERWRRKMRAEEARRQKEDEAQLQRLKDRMTPQRSNTTGRSSTRRPPTVEYEYRI